MPSTMQARLSDAEYLTQGMSGGGGVLTESGPVTTFATDEVGKILEVGLQPTFIDGRWRTIDHAAQVVASRAEVDRLVDAFERRGALVVEAPYEFPEGVCDTTLPRPFHKYMGTVQLASGLLVISAPMSQGDQLSQHLATFGERVPHHVAVLVHDIYTAVQAWAARGWQAGPVTDDGSLAQVFLGSPATRQLIELISRRDQDGRATFSCGNVAALSRAEETLRSKRALR